jgi:hypothetical protein
MKTAVEWLQEQLKDVKYNPLEKNGYSNALERLYEQAKEMEKQQNDTSKVKRVEVIQHSPPYNGRAFTKYNAKDVEIQFQDDGRTLKIFLT